MATDPALPPVIGAIATDRDGDALGTVTTVFLDDATERPTWVGLTDGMDAAPGDVPVVVPVTDVGLTEGRLVLPVSAAAVRSAPRVSRPDRLSPEEEVLLREHYGARPAAPATGTGSDTDGGMTRTEEQLQVTTVVEPWTRAVLRIEEVTEEVMVPVTITRQEARIEYLPLDPGEARTAGDAAPAGTARPTSTSGWVTLYADQPSVTLQRVPAERVRLSTAWVTEETAVSEQLRQERIELTTTEIPRV